MGSFDDAIAAYEKGLTVEPGLAMLTNGLADAKAAAESDKGGGLGGLGAVFRAPDALQKIASDPRTAGYLSDPSFMMKFQQLQQNPEAIGMHLQDPRIMNVIGVLMGINIQTPESMGAGASAPPPKPKEPEPEPEPEVELTEEEKAAKALKAEADGHKEKGNAAYKSKQFDEAIKVRRCGLAVARAMRAARSAGRCMHAPPSR